METGEIPGTLNVDPAAPSPTIRVLGYGPVGMVEDTDRSPDDLPAYLATWPATWVDVVGLGHAETIAAIGRVFGLHALALEDVVYVHQRPKVEPYGDHVFVVLRMVHVADLPNTEQVSLFVGPGFVLTFQEKPGDCFEPIRERIRHALGRLRSAGPDYLAYALIDAVIDSYFPAIEYYGNLMDELEVQIMADPGSQAITRVHQTKRELIALRRIVWPTREAVNSLCRDTGGPFKEETRVYLRDCYDHSVQTMELVEAYREAGSDLTNLGLAVASNRMNEVMKVLTVIATIFIPLTFIAGIYGMNFDAEKSPWNMPELKWYLGYPLCMGLMAAVAVGMIVFFRRKGWLGGDGREPGEQDAP